MILLKRGWKLSLLWVLVFSLGIGGVKAQFNFSFPLTNKIKPNELILGGSAKLTADVIDPSDNGWLRLTFDKNNEKGWAYIDKEFPSTLGLLVQFEYKIWSSGGNGRKGLADGLSVFLYDGVTNQASFRSGNNGGALVYANGVDVDGLSNGYLGIGLDEYGNFSTASEGKIGGTSVLIPNSIALRGGAAGHYPYIVGSGGGLVKSSSTNNVANELAGTSIGYTSDVSARPADDKFYRKVRFYLLPTTDGKDFQITVELQKDAGGPFYTVIKDQKMGAMPPKTLKVGFGASTGGGWANHEVRYLTVSTPVDLSVKTTIDKTSARITARNNVNNDDKVTYITVVSNPGINAITGADPVALSIETDGVTIPVDVSFGVLKSDPAISISKNLTQSNSTKHVYDITNFPVGGSLTLTYHGTIVRNTSFVATNKASITPPTSFLDINSNNNVSAVSTTILRDVDLKVVSTVDVSTPQLVNAQLNYTTVLSNVGPEGIINSLSATLSIETNGTNINANSIHWVYNTIAGNGNMLITKNDSQSGPGKYVYNIANFPAGGAITFTYNGIITSRSESVTNKATITPPPGGFYETDNSNNVSIVTTPLIKELDLQVVNRVDLSEARKNDRVTYTTVVSNLGINTIMGSNTATLSITTSGVSIQPADVLASAVNSQGIRVTHNTSRSTADTQVYDITNFPAGGSLTLVYRGGISSESLPATNSVKIGAPEYFLDIKSDNNESMASTAIIKALNLAVTTTVDQTIQVVGTILNYTTVMFNLGPNDATNVMLSIDKNGVQIDPERFQVFTTLGKSDGLIRMESNTSDKHVYSITNFPVGGTITLTYEGKILSNNGSAVNKSTIAPPVSGYYDTDNRNNISVAQTFIKPILTQPHSITICPEELINQTLVSDNPSLTSYTWASAPSTSTIRVYESSKGGHTIQGFIKNSRITGGTVVYTITPTIKAPIMPANGGKSVAYTSTLGEAKSFTVTIKSLAEAPGVLVAKPSIHYLESAVFTPSSSLSSTTYHWYRSADKHKPVRNGLINRDGVLTMSKLLPGTHTFYVAVFNPNRCEGAVAPISVTVKPIPVVKPPSAFTPNGDGINDVWEIPKIEQYPHCTVHVWGREKGEESVYEARDGYHEPWDGTNKQGKPLTGTYWYRIDLKDGSEPIVGHIAVIR